MAAFLGRGVSSNPEMLGNTGGGYCERVVCLHDDGNKCLGFFGVGRGYLMRHCRRRFICVLTVIGDRFWSPLIAAVVSALLVLGLPGVIDLQAAVELLSAGGQQLDVCAPEHDTKRVNDNKKHLFAVPQSIWRCDLLHSYHRLFLFLVTFKTFQSLKSFELNNEGQNKVLPAC